MLSSVHTCCDVKRENGAGYHLLVAGELDVDPRQVTSCLEDIPAGIGAGKQAGMQTCAVWDAYKQREPG